MSAEQQMEREIIEAIVFLRTENHTVPSDTIEFMKQASLEKLRNPEPNYKVKTYCFDCWDRHGNMDTKEVTALTPEQAIILFKNEYPDLGYDEPYC